MMRLVLGAHPNEGSASRSSRWDLTLIGLSVFKVSFSVAESTIRVILRMTTERSSGLTGAERSSARLRHTHDGGLNERGRRRD